MFLLQEEGTHGIEVSRRAKGLESEQQCYPTAWCTAVDEYLHCYTTVRGREVHFDQAGAGSPVPLVRSNSLFGRPRVSIDTCAVARVFPGYDDNAADDRGVQPVCPTTAKGDAVEGRTLATRSLATRILFASGQPRPVP